MIRTYGVEATIKYCEMRAREWELVAGSHTYGSDEANEAYYERDWWSVEKDKLESELNKNINRNAY